MNLDIFHQPAPTNTAFPKIRHGRVVSLSLTVPFANTTSYGSWVANSNFTNLSSQWTTQLCMSLVFDFGIYNFTVITPKRIKAELLTWKIFSSSWAIAHLNLRSHTELPFALMDNFLFLDNFYLRGNFLFLSKKEWQKPKIWLANMMTFHFKIDTFSLFVSFSIVCSFNSFPLIIRSIL